MDYIKLQMGETTSRLAFGQYSNLEWSWPWEEMVQGNSGKIYNDKCGDLKRALRWQEWLTGEIHQWLLVSAVLQKRLWELNWCMRWVQVSVTLWRANLSPSIMNRLSGWICTGLQVEHCAQLWALHVQVDAGPLEKVWKIALGTSSDSVTQPLREDWRNHGDLADQTKGSCSKPRVFKYVKCSCTKGE